MEASTKQRSVATAACNLQRRVVLAEEVARRLV